MIRKQTVGMQIYERQNMNGYFPKKEIIILFLHKQVFSSIRVIVNMIKTAWIHLIILMLVKLGVYINNFWKVRQVLYRFEEFNKTFQKFSTNSFWKVRQVLYRFEEFNKLSKSFQPASPLQV